MGIQTAVGAVGEVIIRGVLLERDLPQDPQGISRAVREFCAEAHEQLERVDRTSPPDTQAHGMVRGCERGLDRLRATSEDHSTPHAVSVDLEMLADKLL